MLPANLAKGRTAARGLGELVMVAPGSGMLQTLRYSPYSVPSTNTAMVALSQPMSFSSPAPQPLVSCPGSSGLPHPGGGIPQLQLFGLDAANPANQISINQLLAGQLSLAGGKTGFYGDLTGFETGLDQFQPGFNPMQTGFNLSTVQVGI